jgi:hypothetical protein
MTTPFKFLPGDVVQHPTSPARYVVRALHKGDLIFGDDGSHVWPSSGYVLISRSWTDWTGGENPIPGYWVEVEFNDRSIDQGISNAWAWNREQDLHVIRYRVLEHPAAKKAPPAQGDVNDKSHPRFIAGYSAGLNDARLEADAKAAPTDTDEEIASVAAKQSYHAHHIGLDWPKAAALEALRLKATGIPKVEAVDPLLIEAREIAAAASDQLVGGSSFFAAEVRAGQNDRTVGVQAALAALRRGAKDA